MAAVIRVFGLKKSFGELEVLKGIDLHVEKKEVGLFFGANVADGLYEH